MLLNHVIERHFSAIAASFNIAAKTLTSRAARRMFINGTNTPGRVFFDSPGRVPLSQLTSLCQKMTAYIEK